MSEKAMREAIEDAVHGALVRWSNGEQPKPIRAMVADAVLQALPATPEGNLREGQCKRIFLAAHADGWTANQQRRDVQHIDAEKSWEAFVGDGALAIILAATPLHDLESREGWKDIATAPKDGLFFVYTPGIGVGVRVSAMKEGAPDPSTHWCELNLPPLPASPSIQEKGE